MALQPSRREFIAASAAAGTFAAAPSIYAAGNQTLKVGLIGCGGRGTGAAAQALAADRDVELTAMADAFDDRLQEGLASLKKLPEIAAKVKVTPQNCFVGFEGYKDVIAQCDVVLLCTPPHFRPLHLKAAVEAGKHVFAEKPVAVDGPGVRSVIASCEEAKKKKLSVVSGLCLRCDEGFRQTVRRLHDGAIGDVVMIQANDYRSGRWAKPRQPDWTDMHYQMRNWYNFTWLSGDFNVEQHIHFLDVAAWVMKNQYPIRAMGVGGRAVLTGTEYGNIYDHFSVIYEYPNAARLVSTCRQQPRCKDDLSAHVLGSKGRALLSERTNGLTITGNSSWAYEGQSPNMYQVEHDELFASIRAGKPINQGEYMAKSTLLAIMGRMAAYTGQQVTWEMALNSKENLTPPKYDWDTKLTDPAIAVPGVTKFV